MLQLTNITTVTITDLEAEAEAEMDQHREDSSDGSCRKTTAHRQFIAEDVDAQADNFIKNFRKQLRLEREESLKRCRVTIAQRSKQVHEYVEQ